MFLSVDGTAWFQLVNFVIFFAILNVVFLRPVGRAIRERRDYIDGLKRDTEQAQEEARGLRERAEEQRAAARRIAAERFAAARAAAMGDAEQLTQEHAELAAAIAAEARATVEAEIEGARLREDQLAQTLGNSLLDRALEALRA